ncbi:hypothetical protein PENSPDRAFT_656839 [Peniophora sp. CONT]|nr:hypothetical protein PENSPDRAFT_656839 [Peniophora sp. CONT]
MQEMLQEEYRGERRGSGRFRGGCAHRDHWHHDELHVKFTFWHGFIPFQISANPMLNTRQGVRGHELTVRLTARFAPRTSAMLYASSLGSVFLAQHSESPAECLAKASSHQVLVAQKADAKLRMPAMCPRKSAAFQAQSRCQLGREARSR